MPLLFNEIILKKPVTFFLLSLFVLYSFGYVCLYVQQKSQIHTEFFAGLSTGNSAGEIEIIKLKKTDLKSSGYLIWLEENEFSYHGRLYDIVKKIEKGDSVYYYCHNDKKEENLVKCFTTLIEQNTSESGLTNKLNKYIFSGLLLFGDFEHPSSYNPEFESNIIKRSFTHTHSSHYMEIPSPPPKS